MCLNMSLRGSWDGGLFSSMSVLRWRAFWDLGSTEILMAQGTTACLQACLQVGRWWNYRASWFPQKRLCAWWGHPTAYTLMCVAGSLSDSLQCGDAIRGSSLEGTQMRLPDIGFLDKKKQKKTKKRERDKLTLFFTNHPDSGILL